MVLDAQGKDLDESEMWNAINHWVGGSHQLRKIIREEKVISKEMIEEIVTSRELPDKGVAAQVVRALILHKGCRRVIVALICQKFPRADYRGTETQLLKYADSLKDLAKASKAGVVTKSISEESLIVDPLGLLR